MNNLPNARVVRVLLLHDLQLGPRSPILLWALVLPVVLTFVVRAVFGGLFDESPRLGIVDPGGVEAPSEVTRQLLELTGIDAVLLDESADPTALLTAHDLDAALVLSPGFEESVRAGGVPTLDLRLAGESLASNRIVVAVSTLQAVRDLADSASAVEVTVESVGDAGLGIEQRMVPMLVLMAVAVAGAMVPAMSLVDERTHRTMTAVLVGPANVGDVLLGKALLGILLAVLTGVVTAAMNGVLGLEPLGMVLSIVVGAVMMAELGLMLGSWAADSNTLFTAWKSGATLLFAPAFVRMFPAIPEWIGQVVPTWWFVDPVFRLGIDGDRTTEVLPELAVGILVIAVLAIPVRTLGLRMERKLVGGPARSAATPREKVPA